LYFALLHKTARPTDHVLVIDQNRADATYGWGVVFSDKALTFLEGGDARFMAVLLDRLERVVDELRDGVRVGGRRRAERDFSGVGGF